MKSFKLCLILLIMLVSSYSAYGIGLRSRSLLDRLDYYPNLEFSNTYEVRTTSYQTQDIKLFVKGDLAEYVTLEPSELKNIVADSYPKFTATLRLPAGLDKIIHPGQHTIRIRVEETVTRSGGGIGVLTAAEALIIVRFLYPGKFLEAELNIKDVEVNKPANLEVNIFNGGTENINSAKAKIDIFDFSDRLLATLYTEEKPLNSNTRDTLHAVLDTTGLKSGQYKGVATVYYDGLETQDEEQFRVGSLEIRIVDYTKEVPANKISPFDIEIESRWNNNIEGVFGEVSIGKRTFKTPAIDIKAWNKGTLEGYFDAVGMEPGEYDAQILVYYSNNTAKEVGKVTIKEAKVELAPISTSTMLLVIIIILLVIGDIIFLIYNRKKNK